MFDPQGIGIRISEYRKAAGLKQDDLANMLYMTRQAISRWETGIGEPPLYVLVRLAEIFGVTCDELLGLGESKPIKVDFDDIFKSHRREYIISKIVDGDIKVDIPSALAQMSLSERMTILSKIKDGTLKVSDKRALWAELIASERKYLGGTAYEICEGDSRRKRALPSGKR